MAHIVLGDVKAWLEKTKLDPSTIEANLETQIATLIKSRLQPVFDTSGWVNDSNTPPLVRTIIAMYYVAAIYDRTYTDENPEDTNTYANVLRRLADANIAGLLNGSLVLPEDPDAADFSGQPSFFPTDASSANDPTPTSPSDGGPAFLMGSVFQWLPLVAGLSLRPSSHSGTSRSIFASNLP